MRWIPPRSLGDRTLWAEEHPWIAGCYFGLMLTVFISAFEMIRTRASIWLVLAIGVPTWVFAWVPFSLMVKRRFGQRPHAEQHPTPTWRRPWTRASDRVLSLLILMGLLGVLAWLGGLITRTENPFLAGLVLVSGTWFLGTAWVERQRRRREPV